MDTLAFNETQVASKDCETQTTVEQTTDDETKCGICYTDLNNKNTVMTPCNHAFCSSCFFKWLGRKETCALCRSTLLSNTVVEERAIELEEIQDEIVVAYGYMRRLKYKVHKNKCKLKNLEYDTNSLLNRQIRMRSLLQQTRSACCETLANDRNLKYAMELQSRSLELMKKNRKEWDELLIPVPPTASTEEETETAVEMEEYSDYEETEEETEEDAEEENRGRRRGRRRGRNRGRQYFN